MGFVRKTPAGAFRACWRDPAGGQKSKTFPTKKQASAFLTEVEGSQNRGTYIDPHAGRVRFGDFARRWQANRRTEARTNERTASALRTHVMPKWEGWPLGKIDHMAVQEWVTELASRMAPATVAKCFSVFSLVMRSAVRTRLIAVDPCDGVKIPSTYKPNSDMAIISRDAFLGTLIPVVPAEHRAILCTAAGAGLRWGECVGLRIVDVGYIDPKTKERIFDGSWVAMSNDDKNLKNLVLRVAQVAVETASTVTIKPYPKTRAGVRTVPAPPFLAAALRDHIRKTDRRDPATLLFGTRTGTALRRSNFRRQVWRPALVRAGLLGNVTELGSYKFRASWQDAEGLEWSKEFTTERDAVAHVVDRAAGGLRFHDLRHSYATWLISDGVPVNIVQKVMGHQQASTTLNRYVHAPEDYLSRVLGAFADPAASTLPPPAQGGTEPTDTTDAPDR